MQQTKDEEPVTKSSQQKNKKQQTAIRGPVRFLFPKTLRRQPRLRRSGLGTASNEVREFRFRGASPSQASTTESSQDYNTQGAPRRLGGRSRSSKSSEEVNAKLNKSSGAVRAVPCLRAQNYISQRAAGSGSLSLGLGVPSRHRRERW